MRCAYCEEEFTGKAIFQDGDFYCSRSCADQAVAEEEYEDYEEYDDESGEEDYDDALYEEGFELDYSGEDELSL